MFQNQINKKHVTYIGLTTQAYAVVWWLEGTERVAKTVCCSGAEVADVINNRTKYTADKGFEIEYLFKGTPAMAA